MITFMALIVSYYIGYPIEDWFVAFLVFNDIGWIAASGNKK